MNASGKIALKRSSHFFFAFTGIALVTALLFALREALDPALIALIYLIPLGMITTYWGLGPGVASAFAAFLTFNYFFIEPYYTFAVHQPVDVMILVIFLVVAIVISQLVGRMQWSLATANAREREATQLFELSAALADLRDIRSIAQLLAKKTFEVSKSDAVEIKLVQPEILEYRLPESIQNAEPPDWVLPIEMAKGTLGEIRLWKKEQPFGLEEKRLLQTFASQGAVALERARLSQTESRARILEESDHLKTVILSSVSHELRTPLSTIKAAASSLRSGEVGWDSPVSAELISAIDDEADHLNLLVGNLLDMSRIELGALKPKREWNILPEIVGSVLSRMKRLAADHQILLDIPEDLPLAPVDYVQMEQVFTNLLSNSVKYAPQNSVIQIIARHEQDLESIHVIVTNQSPKIPQEHIERIFDKFFRITAADRVTGTGLGLSICKGIVEAHNGKIWAENIEDGLAFHFTLPLILEGAPPPKLPFDTETA